MLQMKNDKRLKSLPGSRLFFKLNAKGAVKLLVLVETEMPVGWRIYVIFAVLVFIIRCTGIETVTGM